MFKGLISQELCSCVHQGPQKQGNNFTQFAPVFGQFDEEFTLCIRCCFLLGGFPGYFKGMEVARLMSTMKFNCTAIWTFFGEFF